MKERRRIKRVKVRRTFVSRDEILRIIKRTPLDPGFSRDIEDAVGATIDEIELKSRQAP
jgi:hypothetical protein